MPMPLRTIVTHSLGVYQYCRKMASICDRSHYSLAHQPVSELANKEHYQVLLQGYYDNDKQFIYDNQIVNSNAGYYVLTPFVLKAHFRLD
jgi:cytochrome oxidase assembly protein ShyY1